MQLDESTLRDNQALLVAYVRYIHNGVSKEEMLFSKPLETDTRGETIFIVVKKFSEEKNIPIGNIICATDGAPSMIGRLFHSKTSCCAFNTSLTFDRQANS